ncbi:hypothetical protein EBESD8_38230 [Rhodococcus aetherivorans]|nr:hypothetical protein EBESD8_38230 [Rhodococcus aetherivorans]
MRLPGGGDVAAAPGAPLGLRRHPGTTAASCGRSSVTGTGRAREVLRGGLSSVRAEFEGFPGTIPCPAVL